MGQWWLESERDDDAAARADNFWSAIAEDIDAGAFWADEIKKYRDEPGKRLYAAMQNLPLPAAFREAAVATRALIRDRRKKKQPFDRELGLLYWLAAINSFMLPYAERLKEPGFNVTESIPGKRIRSLAIDYSELGYEQLDLLNKTDKKWLVELWGDPKSHTTLNHLYRWLWDEYEDKLIRRRRANDEVFVQELREMLHGTSMPAPKQIETKRSGCLGVIAMLVVLGVAAVALARIAG